MRVDTIFEQKSIFQQKEKYCVFLTPIVGAF